MALPSIKRIAKLALVTADLAAAEAFLIETFDCELIEHTDADDAYATLLGLPQTQVRKALLALGEQQIELLAFDPSGRAYPTGSTSSDLWFQHFAIIVSDMAAAMKRLQQSSRFAPISEGGVQHLPPDSGSVSAFKFRDAEGHPLEFLAFPQGGGPDVWEAKRGKVFSLASTTPRSRLPIPPPVSHFRKRIWPEVGDAAGKQGSGTSTHGRRARSASDRDGARARTGSTTRRAFGIQGRRPSAHPKWDAVQRSRGDPFRHGDGRHRHDRRGVDGVAGDLRLAGHRESERRCARNHGSRSRRPPLPRVAAGVTARVRPPSWRMAFRD